MSDSKLDLILTNLETMEKEQQEMKKEMSDRFDSLETKSDSIMEQVVKNSEDITVIKDNQQIIAEIVKRQEDTINILARRSIDQEAEIKRIK